MTKILRITEEKPKDKPKSTLAEKVENITGGIKISKPTLDILSKIGIYSANYFPELLSNLYEAKTSIGNAYGAIGFAALDVLSRKNEKFKRLAKVGGYFWYVGEGIYDLTSALIDQENIGAHLGNFALDVSMAYQLGKDMSLLYKSLDTQSEKDKKSGISKDFNEVVSLIKEKFKSKKEIETSEKITSEETTSKKSKSFSKYLLNFGEKSLIAMEFGASAGYGFGKSAFEKIGNYSSNKIENLKENYSEYSKKRAEKIKIKKEKDAQRSKELPDFKGVSFKKKKEILEHLGDCEKNPKFMEKYEIENEYVNFKQKPIDEQIKIMQDKKNYLEKSLDPTKNISLLKKILNFEDIYNLESDLKKVENILWELDIEKKNPQKTINKYL